MSKRLNRQDWVGAGLQALAKDGPSALKADRLAAQLNVSRGSFYWHFDNLAAFHSAVLDGWFEIATSGVIEEIEKLPRGAARLDRLLEIAFSADRAMERGIRAWGAQSELVSGRVDQVDGARVAYLTKLITEMGWSAGEAKDKAVLLYLSNLGRLLVSDDLAQSVSLSMLQDSAKRR